MPHFTTIVLQYQQAAYMDTSIDKATNRYSGANPPETSHAFAASPSHGTRGRPGASTSPRVAPQQTRKQTNFHCGIQEVAMHVAVPSWVDFKNCYFGSLPPKWRCVRNSINFFCVVAVLTPPKLQFLAMGSPCFRCPSIAWSQEGPEQDFHRFWFHFGTLF